MSIYEGTPVEQNYAHGFDEGRAWAEQDVPLGLGVITNWLIQAREDANNASARWARAYYLGYLRGYREVVRTLNNGRWGT
jgi:hypothetical protein